MFFRRPSPPPLGPVPAHWADDPDFRQCWDDLAGLATFDCRHRVLLEQTTLLLWELRKSGPDFPADRHQALQDALELLGLTEVTR